MVGNVHHATLQVAPPTYVCWPRPNPAQQKGQKRATESHVGSALILAGLFLFFNPPEARARQSQRVQISLQEMHRQPLPRTFRPHGASGISSRRFVIWDEDELQSLTKTG